MFQQKKSCSPWFTQSWCHRNQVLNSNRYWPLDGHFLNMQLTGALITTSTWQFLASASSWVSLEEGWRASSIWKEGSVSIFTTAALPTEATVCFGCWEAINQLLWTTKEGISPEWSPYLNVFAVRQSRAVSLVLIRLQKSLLRVEKKILCSFCQQIQKGSENVEQVLVLGQALPY